MIVSPVYKFEEYNIDGTVILHNPLQSGRFMSYGAKLLDHYSEGDLLSWVFNFNDIKHLMESWRKHELKPKEEFDKEQTMKAE
jgi:hypothetical protein